MRASASSGTRPVRGAAIPAIVAAVLAMTPRSTPAFEGRYVGTYQEADYGEETRVLDQRTDLEGHRALFRGVDGNWGAALRYTTRPGEENLDLMRSRFFGDARGRRFRLQGQWIPWQDRRPGPESPRQQEFMLGGDCQLARGPRASVNWNRADIEDQFGRAVSEDKRADLSQEWSGLRGHVGWRRLDSDPPAARQASPFTNEEWRGDAGIERTWGNVGLNLVADAVKSHYEQAARNRDFHAQGGEGGLHWRPERRTTVSASALWRTGETEDNAFAAKRPFGDRALSVGAQYRPWRSLALDASREYRHREGTEAEDVTTDFVLLGAKFDKPLTRAATFQAGNEYSVELAGSNGDVPRNTTWAIVDARVRQGVQARADVRTQYEASYNEGRLWHTGAQLTLTPTDPLRLDLTWLRDVLPIIEGAAQHEREWSGTLGWEPRDAFHLTSSLRVRHGEGRTQRFERNWTSTATWSLPRGSDINFDGAYRVDESQGRRGQEQSWGVSLTARLPREARLIGSFRRVDRMGAPIATNATITLNLNFALGART